MKYSYFFVDIIWWKIILIKKRKGIQIWHQKNLIHYSTDCRVRSSIPHLSLWFRQKAPPERAAILIYVLLLIWRILSVNGVYVFGDCSGARFLHRCWVFNPEEFEHQKYLINSISHIVSREGKIVYDRTRKWTARWFEKGDHDLQAAKQSFIRKMFRLIWCVSMPSNVLRSIWKGFSHFIELLTSYAVETRYPDDFQEYTSRRLKKPLPLPDRSGIHPSKSQFEQEEHCEESRFLMVKLNGSCQ